MLSTSTETCFTVTSSPASAIRRVCFGLCATSWGKSGNGSAEKGARAYCVSHPSVFQHHFWTGVLSERVGGEAGGRGASCKREADVREKLWSFFPSLCPWKLSEPARNWPKLVRKVLLKPLRGTHETGGVRVTSRVRKRLERSWMLRNLRESRPNQITVTDGSSLFGRWRMAVEYFPRAERVYQPCYLAFCGEHVFISCTMACWRQLLLIRGRIHQDFILTLCFRPQ